LHVFLEKNEGYQPLMPPRTAESQDFRIIIFMERCNYCYYFYYYSCQFSCIHSTVYEIFFTHTVHNAVSLILSSLGPNTANNMSIPSFKKQHDFARYILCFVKENEMGRTCSTNVEKRNAYKILVGKPEETTGKTKT
jgi:hypothetical protein